MKKRILQIVFSLAVVFSLTITSCLSVYAGYIGTLYVNPEWSEETVLPEGKVWGTDAFSTIQAANAELEGDTIALAGDVALAENTVSDKSISIPKGIKLDSNGKVFTLNNSLVSEGSLDLKDAVINVSDSSIMKEESVGKYSYKNGIKISGDAELTNAVITEEFSDNLSWSRSRGIYVLGTGTDVKLVTEEGKTTSISYNRTKARNRSQTGWSFGISLGDGNDTDNAKITASGAGNLSITGHAEGPYSGAGDYGFTINGIRVNGENNKLIFANEGKTTITESSPYGVNGIVNYGTTEFTDGSVLINSYIDDGVGFADNNGLFNYGDASSCINITDNVDDFTVFTEGYGYSFDYDGNVSAGAAAIHEYSVGGSTTVNSKKLNILAVSGEDTDKQWTIGGTTVTGHTKYSEDKKTAVGQDYSTSYGILNDSTGSVLVGKNTDTNIHTRDLKKNTVAVASTYAEGTVDILGNATIWAEGGDGTLALYAKDGGSITVGSSGKNVNITGDILATGSKTVESKVYSSSVILAGVKNAINGNVTVGDSAVADLGTAEVSGKITIDAYGTLNLSEPLTATSVNNSGTILVDMTGQTSSKVVLIDANATSDYGTYDFAEGKSNGYILMVINNDLVALNKVASVFFGGETGIKEYYTVQEAIDDACKAEGVTGIENAKTVKLIADAEVEEITVPEDGYVILDLNGHVLKNCSEDGRVIYNKGSLKIIDSDPTAKHYFKYSDSDVWQLDENAGEGISVSAITSATENDTVIEVQGGCITGGICNTTGETNGAGILNSGTLDISGCNIIGNKCIALNGYSADGAAIYSYATTSTVTLKNTSVIGNAVTGNAGSDDSNHGGGIYTNGTLNAENVTFGYNIAEGEEDCGSFGGGLYVRSNSTTTLTKCTFVGNTADNGGGIDSYGKLTIDSCTISGNTATSGGGLYVQKGTGSETSITGGEISGNTATDGGGIFNANTLSISGTKISGNTASNAGGGILNKGDAAAVTLIDCEISGNNAYLGGGIVNLGCTILGGTTKISNNTASFRVPNYGTIKNGGVINISTEKPLASGADIGVALVINNSYAYTTGKITSNGTEDYSDYFTSDCSSYQVKFVTDHFEISLCTVTEATCKGGTVSVGTKKTFMVGDTVTLTNTPESTDWEFDSYKAYKTGDEETVVTVTDGEFSMPQYDVTVEAVFRNNVVEEQIDSLNAELDSYTQDNVTSADAEAIKAIKKKADEADTENALQDQKDALTEISEKCAELLKRIEDTAKALDDIKKAADKYTADSAALTDKSDIQKAIDDAKEINAGNLTADEKAKLDSCVASLEKAKTSIENAENVIDEIEELPEEDEVKLSDEDAIGKVYDAYNKLTDHEKSLVSKEMTDKLAAVKAAADKIHKMSYEPEIIKGAGQTVNTGKAKTAEFTSNAPFDQFVKVTVDDKDVDSKYYTAVSGSTVVTLKKDFLKTLAAGKHTLSIVSAYGHADTEFTIEIPESAPDTGDSSNVILYCALTLFSIAGACAVFRNKKHSI